MGEVVNIRDYRRKEENLKVSERTEGQTGLSLDMPPEILLALYESQIGLINIPPYQVSEKDPA